MDRCGRGGLGALPQAGRLALPQVKHAGMRCPHSHVTQVLTEARVAGALTTHLSHDQLGLFLVNAWEGSVLRAKVTRSRAPLDAFFDVFDSLVA